MQWTNAPFLTFYAMIALRENRGYKSFGRSDKNLLHNDKHTQNFTHTHVCTCKHHARACSSCLSFQPLFHSNVHVVFLCVLFLPCLCSIHVGTPLLVVNFC